jgi:hypothetical protein
MLISASSCQLVEKHLRDRRHQSQIRFAEWPLPFTRLRVLGKGLDGSEPILLLQRLAFKTTGPLRELAGGIDPRLDLSPVLA